MNTKNITSPATSPAKLGSVAMATSLVIIVPKFDHFVLLQPFFVAQVGLRVTGEAIKTPSNRLSPS